MIISYHYYTYHLCYADALQVLYLSDIIRLCGMICYDMVCAYDYAIVAFLVDSLKKWVWIWILLSYALSIVIYFGSVKMARRNKVTLHCYCYYYIRAGFTFTNNGYNPCVVDVDDMVGVDYNSVMIHCYLNGVISHMVA
jgi:hypothetical protein